MSAGAAPTGLRLAVVRCLGAAVLFAASAPAASRLAGTVPSVTLAGLLYLGAGLGVAPFVYRRSRFAARTDPLRHAGPVSGAGGVGSVGGAGDVGSVGGAGGAGSVGGAGGAGSVGGAPDAGSAGRVLGAGPVGGAGGAGSAGRVLGAGSVGGAGGAGSIGDHGLAGSDGSVAGARSPGHERNVAAGSGSVAGVGRVRAFMGSEWMALAVAVLAGGALGPVLLVAGLARTSAASASILLNLELSATVLFAWLFFREHVGPVLGAAVGLITASGAVLAWGPGATLDAGALLVTGACLCWGLDNVVTARIEQLTPAQVVLAKGVLAGGANATIGMVWYGAEGVPGWGSALAAMAIGTAGYGWSITLWVKGARDLGAARAQVCFSTAPFIGAGLAWALLGEDPTLLQGVAVVVAGAGVVLSLASAHTHPHLHPVLRHAHEHRHPDVHHDNPAHDEAHNAAQPAADVTAWRHTHEHDHPEQRHDSPHVPDVHHRHDHELSDGDDPP